MSARCSTRAFIPTPGIGFASPWRTIELKPLRKTYKQHPDFSKKQNNNIFNGVRQHSSPVIRERLQLVGNYNQVCFLKLEVDFSNGRSMQGMNTCKAKL